MADEREDPAGYTFSYNVWHMPPAVREEQALIGAIVIQMDRRDPATRRRILAYLNALYPGEG